jgi:hypothetical protein
VKGSRPCRCLAGLSLGELFPLPKNQSHKLIIIVRRLRYKVFRHEKVGCGFFSDVYRGTGVAWGFEGLFVHFALGWVES